MPTVVYLSLIFRRGESMRIFFIIALSFILWNRPLLSSVIFLSVKLLPSNFPEKFDFIPLIGTFKKSISFMIT